MPSYIFFWILHGSTCHPPLSQSVLRTQRHTSHVFPRIPTTVFPLSSSAFLSTFLSQYYTTIPLWKSEQQNQTSKKDGDDDDDVEDAVDSENNSDEYWGDWFTTSSIKPSSAPAVSLGNPSPNCSLIPQQHSITLSPHPFPQLVPPRYTFSFL